MIVLNPTALTSLVDFSSTTFDIDSVAYGTGSCDLDLVGSGTGSRELDVLVPGSCNLDSGSRDLDLDLSSSTSDQEFASLSVRVWLK